MNIELRDKEVIVDGVSYYLKEENKNSTPQTEFKKGLWMRYNNPNTKGLPIIFRIKAVGGGGVELLSDNNGWLQSEYCRPAIPAEIESHLIKEAKKRGYGEGVLFLSAYSGSKSKVTGGSFVYEGDMDILLSCGNAVYWDGNWATILPDKKPLPKSREEFVRFHNEAMDSPLIFTAFLDQYDFND